MRSLQGAIACVAAALLSANAGAGEGKSGHHHHSHGQGSQTYSAGEPGNPKKPSRIIEVTMREADGQMLFAPARLEVSKGEQIKFVLRNRGQLDHEFILASTADNLEHAKAMQKNPEMVHAEQNGRQLGPDKRGEIIWKFTRSGEFEYACLIPGHREAGMTGKILVK